MFSAAAFAAVLSASVFSCDALAARARLVFTGDIMAHQTQLDAARIGTTGEYDFSYQFAHVKRFLKGDAVVGNYETTASGEDRRYTGYPQFNTPDVLADNVKDAGFTVLTLANNHMHDRGSYGAARTVAVLSERGFGLAGLPINQPLVVDAEGVRVGIINAAYGSNGPLPKGEGSIGMNLITRGFLMESAEQLRRLGADCIVACLHWGDEYDLKPGAAQKREAAWAFEAGVDIVIGTHPHVLQPVEFTEDGRVVFWSLGNFVSGQRTLPRERTAVAAVEVESSGDGRCRVEAAWVLPAAVVKVPLSGRGAATGFVVVPEGAESEMAPAEGRRAAEVNAEVVRFLDLSEERDAFGFRAVKHRLIGEASPERKPAAEGRKASSGKRAKRGKAAGAAK